MNEYLYEISIGQSEPCNDEEMLYCLYNAKLKANRKSKHRKELSNGEESNNNLYC